MNRGEPYPVSNIDLPSTCKVANRVQTGFQVRPCRTINHHNCFLLQGLESSNPFAALDAAWLRNDCYGLHKLNATSVCRTYVAPTRARRSGARALLQGFEDHQGTLATANRGYFLFCSAFFSSAATSSHSLVKAARSSAGNLARRPCRGCRPVAVLLRSGLDELAAGC